MSSQNERTNEPTQSELTAGISRTDEAASPTKSKSGMRVTRTVVEEGVDRTYDCNICLGTGKNAVVTFCGHLYCWPCIYECLRTRPDRQLCPVCMAAIESTEKLIPIYGRNSINQGDPKKGIPPRPEGLRLERQSQPQSQRDFRFMHIDELFFHIMVVLLIAFISLIIRMIPSDY